MWNTTFQNKASTGIQNYMFILSYFMLCLYQVMIQNFIKNTLKFTFKKSLIFYDYKKTGGDRSLLLIKVTTYFNFYHIELLLNLVLNFDIKILLDMSQFVIRTGPHINAYIIGINIFIWISISICHYNGRMCIKQYAFHNKHYK